jgi:uncharacterized protein YfaS (alpha-2-macroglobulin family)
MRVPLLCAALLSACAGGSTPAELRPVVVPVSGGAGGAREPLPEAPVDAVAAKPVLMTEGPLGAVPTSLIIDLLHPVVTTFQAEKAPVDTKLVSEPPVEGTLRWLSPSRLRFEPKAPLEPGATYTFRLEALDTRDGALTLATPATLTLTTPKLAVHHARLVAGAPGAAEQRFEVAFTAPIDADGADGKVSVRLPGGEVIPASDLTQGAWPNVLRFTARHPGLASAPSVDVVVAAGIPGVSGGAAPAGQGPVALPAAGKGKVEIVDVRLREGASGFSIEVLCDDTSVEQRTWRWDDLMGDSRELSARCELDPASLGLVRLEPATPLTVEPVRSGFRLQGDVQRGAWALRLEAGLRTVDGGVLLAPWEGTLLVPGRAPTLDLVASGRYLPRDAWTSLPLRHRNSGPVEVTVRHVPRENLLFWLSSDEEVFDDRTSTVTARSRVAVQGPVDATETAWLDLSALVPQPGPGVYEVTTRFGDAHDAVRLAVTDLQLVAKGALRSTAEAPPAWDVWALDIHRHTPAAGATIQLMRANGQTVARCTTDASGGCRLEPAADPLDPAAPIGLIATRGDDFTFLRFSDVIVPQSEADVAGEPYHDTLPWRASLDSERGVYRPGETVHLVSVLRDAAHNAPPADLPVRLDVQDARGRVLKQVALRTNAAGMVAWDLPLADDAATGAWEARLVVADAVIARHRVSVEDFVPERMTVKASATPAHALHGEPVSIAVDAAYLFGGSAEDSRVDLRCRVEPADFAPPGLKEWRFGHQLADEQPVRRLELGNVEGRLNGAGHADLACPAGESVVVGTSKLIAEVGVFEAGGGRVTRAAAAATLHPARHAIGLKSAARRVEPGETVDVQGVVVDWEGKISAALGSVEVELLHVEEEYGWIWDEDEGYESYRHWRRPVLDGLIKVPVEGGKFKFSFAPAERGSGYLVRVKGGGATSELLFDMNAWSWGEDVSTQTPRPPDPATVLVTAPDRVKPGEPVDVSFTSAWTGRALVTVETDHVLQSQWLDVTPGPVNWRFQLDGFAPNVYVGVLILKDPHGESADAFLPDRAWGTTSVRVAPVEWTLPVTLSVPERVRSGQPLQVEVSAPGDGPTFVTVAAVDEGILQITKFPTPDPLNDLFPRRALGVSTWETVGWSVARANGPSSPGGDTGAPAVQRPPPIQPVALWSGLVEVKGGKATVSLDVPAWDGKLRVFAIAASATKVGSAEASVVVADPVVVQATVPRFLLGGDRAELPVRVTNTTGGKARITVALKAEAVPLGGFVADGVPLTVQGGERTTLELADGASGLAVFRVTAASRAGAAKLSFTAEAPSFTATRSQVVTVSPAAPTARRVTKTALSPGDTALSSQLTGWEPGTERTTFWVTTSPYADALSRLDELIGYPHGCVEQTTSATRPLLYAGNLLPGVVAAVGGRADVDDRVRAGLDRVLSMQTPSGGFGYWPGQSEPSFWGSVYATHLLLDARAAGYAVPADALDQAVGWLGGEIDALASGRRSEAGLPEAEAYAHYVLASAGQPRRARAARLLEAVNQNLTGLPRRRAHGSGQRGTLPAAGPRCTSPATAATPPRCALSTPPPSAARATAAGRSGPTSAAAASRSRSTKTSSPRTTPAAAPWPTSSRAPSAPPRAGASPPRTSPGPSPPWASAPAPARPPSSHSA